MVFDPDKELADLLASLLHPNLKRISPGLERVEKLLAALGNPHHNLPPVIHISGTNGKGSTLAILRAILEAAGRQVHSYTSPHLVSFCERIVLAGQPISKAQLMPILQRIHSMQAEYPTTFFEATTAAAFIAFAQIPADIVLLETGMGGRLDTTNVIAKPLANIITPIGLDHQDFLGDTIAKIAYEKAGIMRASVPAFIARQQPEALEVIVKQPAEHHIAGKDWDCKIVGDDRWQFICDGKTQNLPMPALLGAHQVENAALAITAIRKTMPDITWKQIAEGLQEANWPARLQPINSGYWRKFVPAELPLILDGAHNALAAQELAKWADKLPQKPVLVLAMKSDKDVEAFIAQWQNKAAAIIATIIPYEEEYVSPEFIIRYSQGFDIKCEIESNLEAAICLAASYNRPIIICGSLYLAGAILAKN